MPATQLPPSGILQCPLPQPIQSTTPVLEELQPLLHYLSTNQPIYQKVIFPRGTVMPDGRLDLCKQKIGMVGCGIVTTALAQNHTIASLLLGTNGIGDQGAQAVAQLMERNPHLQVIYLGCNAISATGTAAIAHALTSHQTVHSLWFKRNPLGVEGAAALAEMLYHNHSIHTLDLEHTHLSDAGLAVILEVLIQHNRTVKRLHLGGNQLNHHHAPLLACLLQQNPCLTTLSLRTNHLGDSGLERLATGLQQNQTLQELGLASNGISHIGCHTLLGAIQNHPRLRFVDLGYSPSTYALTVQPNGIGDQGAEVIAKFLADNRVITWLDLRNNGITSRGILSLKQTLTTNSVIQNLLLDCPAPQLESLLQRNRQLNPDDQSQRPPEIALIKSVYRSQ
jgi:Ran GTPase-activating protein (RanGAP) involved in mRNA processing and transport